MNEKEIKFNSLIYYGGLQMNLENKNSFKSTFIYQKLPIFEVILEVKVKMG